MRYTLLNKDFRPMDFCSTVCIMEKKVLELAVLTPLYTHNIIKHGRRGRVEITFM